RPSPITRPTNLTNPTNPTFPDIPIHKSLPFNSIPPIPSKKNLFPHTCVAVASLPVASAAVAACNPFQIHFTDFPGLSFIVYRLSFVISQVSFALPRPLSLLLWLFAMRRWLAIAFQGENRFDDRAGATTRRLQAGGTFSPTQ